MVYLLKLIKLKNCIVTKLYTRSKCLEFVRQKHQLVDVVPSKVESPFGQEKTKSAENSFSHCGTGHNTQIPFGQITQMRKFL